MDVSLYLIYLVLGGACAAWCHRSAAAKGRKPGLWFGLGFAFTLVAVVVLLFLPPRDNPAAIEKTTAD